MRGGEEGMMIHGDRHWYNEKEERDREKASAGRYQVGATQVSLCFFQCSF